LRANWSAAVTYTDANGKSHPDRDCDYNTYSNTGDDCYTDANANSNSNANRYPHTDANSYTNTDAYTYGAAW
jgi:hypothetical protein